MDMVVKVKTLVLGALYNLSDDLIEDRRRDRLSAPTVPGAACYMRRMNPYLA